MIKYRSGILNNSGISVVIVLLTIFATYSCPPPPQGEPEPTPGPGFGIYEGEERPECECILDREDLVLPETVDTGNWGNPQKVGNTLNTDCPEDDPEISSDGTMLYYYWSPVISPDPQEILYGTTGVYYAERTGGPGEFGVSRFIELRKETNGAGDGHPRVVSPYDKIYFHSVRDENTGYQLPEPVNDYLDIYSAGMTGNKASPASNLGVPVNSEYIDGEPEICTGGTRLYFASDRPGGPGKVDIYYSDYSGGEWSVPVNAGSPINTADIDTQPAFSENDPDTMYFASDRNGIGMAIYMSQYNGSVWEDPVLVIQGQVGSPSLTADGNLLYFVHVQTDDTPDDPVFGADIYYVERISRAK